MKKLYTRLLTFLTLSVSLFFLLINIDVVFDLMSISYESKLISAPRSTSQIARSCFSEKPDFERPLSGVWKESLESPPWFNLSCKYQPATSSCSFFEIPQNNRSIRLSKIRFHPNECYLERFNPNKFLQMLKGRTLVIAGDSLSQQLFSSLLCRLEGFVVHDNVIWGKQSNRMMNYCGINGNCMPKSGIHSHYLENYSNPIWASFTHNVKIRYVSIKAEPIDEKLDFISGFTSKEDILILNKGAWRQNGYRDFKKRMLDFEMYYIRNKANLPTIWWRETNPQHFLGPNGDYVPGKKLPPKMKSCAKAPVERLSFSHVDPVNIITNKIMKRVGIPIMYTSNAMVSENDAHVFNSGVDCTHLCTPGVDVIWVEYMYNWLKFENMVGEM